MCFYILLLILLLGLLHCVFASDLDHSKLFEQRVSCFFIQIGPVYRLEFFWEEGRLCRIWSYHNAWAVVHLLLSRPLKACVHPMSDCSVWARAVILSSLSVVSPGNGGIGLSEIHPFRLLMISSWIGGLYFGVTFIC